MRPDLHTLTGAYAVDATSKEERTLFEAHLGACDACRQEVTELQATACRLGVLAAEAPPSALRARVLAEIDQVRQEPPPTRRDGWHPGRNEPAVRRSGPGDPDTFVHDRPGTEDSRRHHPWWDGLLAPAAAIVAVLVVGLSLVATSADDADEVEVTSARALEVLASPDADTITVDGPDGSFARVVVSGARGEAVFLADGMEPAPHEHTYELWLIDGPTATPAGLFDVDERGSVTRVITGDLEQAAAIGVTVEPEGGSPEPTTDPVMLIDLDSPPPPR